MQCLAFGLSAGLQRYDAVTQADPDIARRERWSRPGGCRRAPGGYKDVVVEAERPQDGSESTHSIPEPLESVRKGFTKVPAMLKAWLEKDTTRT